MAPGASRRLRVEDAADAAGDRRPLGRVGGRWRDEARCRDKGGNWTGGHGLGQRGALHARGVLRAMLWPKDGSPVGGLRVLDSGCVSACGRLSSGVVHPGRRRSTRWGDCWTEAPCTGSTAFQPGLSRRAARWSCCCTAYVLAGGGVAPAHARRRGCRRKRGKRWAPRPAARRGCGCLCAWRRSTCRCPSWPQAAGPMGQARSRGQAPGQAKSPARSSASVGVSCTAHHMWPVTRHPSHAGLCRRLAAPSCQQSPDVQADAFSRRAEARGQRPGSRAASSRLTHHRHWIWQIGRCRCSIHALCPHTSATAAPNTAQRCSPPPSFTRPDPDPAQS